MLNLGKFHNIVRLVAFCPFASSQVALENANAVSEGESATTMYLTEVRQTEFCCCSPRGACDNLLSSAKLFSLVWAKLYLMCRGCSFKIFIEFKIWNIW